MVGLRQGVGSGQLGVRRSAACRLPPSSRSGSHPNPPQPAPPRIAPPRTQTLVERVQALEILYAEQMQRLKGYMPNAAIEAAAERRLAAPEGSLLRRVDVLEDGLELLLRAQELSWQEEERRAGQAVKCRTCGGDCVVS
jgi:hypothetical protein